MSKNLIAGILAFLFGFIGGQHFYLKNFKKGILYFLFCWTLIPLIISFFEGIFLIVKDEESTKKNKIIVFGVIITLAILGQVFAGIERVKQKQESQNEIKKVDLVNDVERKVQVEKQKKSLVFSPNDVLNDLKKKNFKIDKQIGDDIFYSADYNDEKETYNLVMIGKSANLIMELKATAIRYAGVNNDSRSFIKYVAFLADDSKEISSWVETNFCKEGEKTFGDSKVILSGNKTSCTILISKL